MSAYGRIWERIRILREALQNRLPLTRIETPNQAEVEIDKLRAVVAQWRELEAKAERLARRDPANLAAPPKDEP